MNKFIRSLLIYSPLILLSLSLSFKGQAGPCHRSNFGGGHHGLGGGFGFGHGRGHCSSHYHHHHTGATGTGLGFLAGVVMGGILGGSNYTTCHRPSNQANQTTVQNVIVQQAPPAQPQPQIIYVNNPPPVPVPVPVVTPVQSAPPCQVPYPPQMGEQTYYPTQYPQYANPSYSPYPYKLPDYCPQGNPPYRPL